MVNPADSWIMIKLLMKRARTLTLSLALVLGGLAVSAPTASAATQLGGLNLNAYCSAKYGTYALNYENNPWYWVCKRTTSNLQTTINMTAACRWQYGSGAYAVLLDSRNPYSWKCYR